MKIITVVGARPNFMKVAPLIASIRKHNEAARAANGFTTCGPTVEIEHILVHTGQHYDALMSDSFFEDLGLPVPDVRLGVGSASHAVQTADVLKAFEQVLLRQRPDVVVVAGDVNSTLACALATAKISFDVLGSRPLLAHVESGLRSFDRSMPEEINRVLTDHISDLLFVTEESGMQNLRDEGIPRMSVHFVGNTMIDTLLAFKERADASTILEQFGLRKGSGDRQSARYGLLTLHRPANVDNRDAFLNILDGLEQLASECPIIFPVHPRTRERIKEFGFEFATGGTGTPDTADETRATNGIILAEPLGYLDFLCLMKHAAIVVTDSGGIQEETTCLGIPCVTARDNTERPVTTLCGTNVIAGTSREKIAAAIRRQIRRSEPHDIPEKWDGHAASRILDILIKAHLSRNPSQEYAVCQASA